MTTIFDPIKLGDLELPNRIIMAPLTRCRAEEGRVPGALIAEYYVQRASAGLILSEATSVTPLGVGYPDTPGIWSDEQVRGWTNVTKAIHAAGGRIFLQLWHVGRISHSLYLNGELPVAPSAIAAEGHVSLVRPKANFEVPRALETAEIADIVEAYPTGAETAKAAGFDGVDSWRQRLPARSVPAKQHQPAHRPIRWFVGKPCPPDAGSHRRGSRSLGCWPRWHALVASRRPARHGR